MSEADYLAKIIECEEKQDSSVPHEWIFDTKLEAVRVANYLRSHGYKVVYKKRQPLDRIILHYVGVAFETLKH